MLASERERKKCYFSSSFFLKFILITISESIKLTFIIHLSLSLSLSKYVDMPFCVLAHHLFNRSFMVNMPHFVSYLN